MCPPSTSLETQTAGEKEEERMRWERKREEQDVDSGSAVDEMQWWLA